MPYLQRIIWKLTYPHIYQSRRTVMCLVVFWLIPKNTKWLFTTFKLWKSLKIGNIVINFLSIHATARHFTNKKEPTYKICYKNKYHFRQNILFCHKINLFIKKRFTRKSKNECFIVICLSFIFYVWFWYI